MSVLEMKVPSPGESISEVEIAQWLVSDGDYVEKDQAIAEVDSDKATLELPAEESGIITLKAEDGDTVAVEEHCALTLDVKMTYVIGQQYVSLPSGRYRLGSEWPTLTLQYKKAIRVADDAVDFDFLQLQIYDEVDFGLLGTFQYKAGAGKFLTAKNVQFMDYKHFNGNQTHIQAQVLDLSQVFLIVWIRTSLEMYLTHSN